MSRERITGRQGGNTTTRFAVCVWTQHRRMGTSRRQTGKGPDGCLGAVHMCNSCCSLWAAGLVAKFVLYATTQYGEGSGSPLQCSCLENPRHGEVWWAAVYGAAQSRTRLKRLSSSSSRLSFSTRAELTQTGFLNEMSPQRNPCFSPLCSLISFKIKINLHEQYSNSVKSQR